MAVAEEAPVAVLGTTLQELESFLGLALAQGDVVDFDSLIGGELVDQVGRIDALGEDDDDWDVRPGVLEDVLNLRGLRCDELRVLERLNDVVFHGEVDSIRPEASEEDHLADRIVTLGLPLAWELSLLRLRFLRTEPILPLFRAQVDRLADVCEVW